MASLRTSCWTAAVVACAGCGSSSTPPAHPEPEPQNEAQPPAHHASPPRSPRWIVVLGSSTAAGKGASAPNTAWVPRYTAYLSEAHPQFEVRNLAHNGYTTYHLLPTGTATPEDRPTPDPESNITRALEIEPAAVVINLPSNDQANGYSSEEFGKNWDLIVQAATAEHVPLWVTTTQPRKGDENLEAALNEGRATISERFGPRTLDFWTPLAEGGLIRPTLDSGDGTHVNDAGHKLLADVVIAAKIPEAVPLTP